MFVIHKWNLLGLNFSFIFLLLLLSNQERQLQHLINLLFLFGSFYLLLSLFLLVVKGQFFDGIAYAARRASSKLSRQQDYLEEWQDKPLPSKWIHTSFLFTILFQGCVLLVLMFVLLLLFYFI